MISEFTYVVLSIIECEFDRCAEEFTNYLNDEVSDKYSIVKESPDLKKIYFPFPQAGGAHMCKILIWEPKNLKGKTAFITNYQDGRHTLIFNYCKHFKRKAVKIAFSNTAIRYPAFMFYYFDFSGENYVERIISLIKDTSKWEFYSSGPTQAFENLEYYNSKNAKGKFNKKIILEYLVKLDIDIENENFCKSNLQGFYFDQNKW